MMTITKITTIIILIHITLREKKRKIINKIKKISIIITILEEIHNMIQKKFNKVKLGLIYLTIFHIIPCIIILGLFC